MYENFQSFLKQWSKTTTERTKLQHSYAIAALALLLVAGLVSLIDASTGQQLLVIVFALTGVFFANAVAWALLDSLILGRIAKQRSVKK